jgi:mono/diheme cytochrome c family protein
MRGGAPRARAVMAVFAAGLLAAVACGGGKKAAPAPGERLYALNCVACHQQHGEGVRGMQPPLAGTPVPVGDPSVLLAWVMFGERPAALPRGQYAGVMPQFAYLKDADLAALLTYVRRSFGNHASEVTPEMVAAARAAHRGG